MNNKTTFFLMLAQWIFLMANPVMAALDESSNAYKWDGKHFSVPLTIKDNSGVNRTEWPVRSGLPLPSGKVKDTNELKLISKNGQVIPCQFTVLSRYWARDKSIRWVLLDFQVDLPANETIVVYLRNDGPPIQIQNPINVTEKNDIISIDTGPLVAEISKETGTIFHKVLIHGQEIIQADPSDGVFIRSGETHLAEHHWGSSWNTHGWNKTKNLESIYVAEAIYSSENTGTTEVTLEEAGPLRVVVRIRGRYKPLEDNKQEGILKDGFYYYTVRLHFFRGKTYIKVDYDIENSGRQRPQWNWLFHEAGIRHHLNLTHDIKVTAGGRESDSQLPTTSTFTLQPNTEGWLHQAAAVGNRFKVKKDRLKPKSGGYQVGLGQDGLITNALASGKYGRFLDVSDGNKGVSIAMRYFWEEAPRAIMASSSELRILAQADNPGHLAQADAKRTEYSLDFGERNIHDILYYFHKGSADESATADIAQAFEYPLFAHAPTQWYSDSETWYFEIARTPGRIQRKMAVDKHWHPRYIGIRGHGWDQGYNSGGNHESLNSGWLSFLRTGHLADLERNLVLSRWHIAHNPGWAYQDNVMTFGKQKDYYTDLDRQLKSWDELTGFGPKDYYLWRSNETYIQKTRKGETVRHRGPGTYLNAYKWLPDHEHYALFRLFEYYYLTGDRRALDAINGFVNWDLNFQHHHLFQRKMRPLSTTDLFQLDPDAIRRGHYARVYSWMLYTNLAGFHATGSEVMNQFSKWQIRRILALLRHRHGQLTRWDVKPNSILGFLPDDWQIKAAEYIPSPMTRSREAISTSTAKTWMEAQGAMALHEAFKTYDDERILDGIWGMADYFSHHVVFFPQLGMMNSHTSMPNRLLSDSKNDTVKPQYHGRQVQVWPILFHYTGWQEVQDRYEAMRQPLNNSRISDLFKQTHYWEKETVPKRSNVPPDTITDLRSVIANNSGITLSWTSPADDGPTGRASRYFVKISDKPIVEFAPTDHPARDAEKLRVVNDTEDLILKRAKGGKIKRKHKLINPGDIRPERLYTELSHPDWHKVNAFWMAEHVANEPDPGPAGSTETFTITELRPHNWFGAPAQPGLETLKPGTYYVAICSWDEDRNLSKLSNLANFTLH